MKGFVPVNKSGLAIMLAKCLTVIERDYVDCIKTTVDNYIQSEKERTTVRHWFRLWTLPKPRFSFTEEGVRVFSSKQYYAMFECNPFDVAERDKDNSIRWVNSLRRIADNAYAGEPISLAINDFKRISEPELYNWVSSYGFGTSVRW